MPYTPTGQISRKARPPVQHTERPRSSAANTSDGTFQDRGVIAALVAVGAHIVGDLTSDTSTADQTLNIIGTGVSGNFLSCAVPKLVQSR